MRATALLLLLPLIAACEDALGPAGGCEGEMRLARITYGQPDSRTVDDDGTTFTETWNYFPDENDAGRTVTFRWGTNLNGCQVTPGPASSRIPTPDLPIAR